MLSFLTPLALVLCFCLLPLGEIFLHAALSPNTISPAPNDHWHIILIHKPGISVLPLVIRVFQLNLRRVLAPINRQSTLTHIKCAV